ncbi:MAG: metallophosphoesterase family protein [Flavobacteriales bacterium]|nr:metallophosphoesterase family protein [Flavobacteriales bacterium]
MKRIGLISDTHGYVDDRILEHLSTVDEIWHAGDIGSLAVTDAMAQVAPVKGVYGNIDGEEIRRVFPGNKRFLCEGFDIWMTHIGGKPYVYSKDVATKIKFNPPDIFICGHSHILRVQKDKRLNCLYMNPGAAGRHGFHKVRTLLRFTLNNKNISDLEVVELGPRARPAP